MSPYRIWRWVSTCWILLEISNESFMARGPAGGSVNTRVIKQQQKSRWNDCFEFCAGRAKKTLTRAKSAWVREEWKRVLCSPSFDSQPWERLVCGLAQHGHRVWHRGSGATFHWDLSVHRSCRRVCVCVCSFIAYLALLCVYLKYILNYHSKEDKEDKKSLITFLDEKSNFTSRGFDYSVVAILGPQSSGKSKCYMSQPLFTSSLVFASWACSFYTRRFFFSLYKYVMQSHSTS